VSNVRSSLLTMNYGKSNLKMTCRGTVMLWQFTVLSRRRGTD